MENLPPVPTILQNHVNMAEEIPVEEPKIVKPTESTEMLVDGIANAESSEGIANAESSDIEGQCSNDVTMDEEVMPTTEINELVEEQEEPTPVKKSKKFNPELVFTLTHLKTGDVMEVTGGVPFVVEKLLSLGLKASSSACNNAVKGVTNSHCGYTISCNQPLKRRVKKTKKSSKKTSPKKKSRKVVKKVNKKKKATKKAKKSRKAVKKVNKKKATKKSRKVVKKVNKKKATKKVKKAVKKTNKKKSKRTVKK